MSTPSPATAAPAIRPTFDLALVLRLCTFQVGSAMGDILVSSIWNRVLIADFGVAATPVGLLIALRLFLSPISVWAGFRSDTAPLFGLRRTGYIWLGRGLMLVALPFLALSLNELGADQRSVLGWIMASFTLLVYGIGTLISGSPYLALVRDAVPPERQGLAIGLAETALIVFFAIFGIVFSFWMRVYDATIMWQMVLGTMLIGGFFWFFAVVGVEKRARRTPVVVANQSAALGRAAVRRQGLRETFDRIWRDHRTRRFFVFLFLSTLAAWTQEVILEPFGAERLGLDVGLTTRFNSFWQTATVVTLVGAAVYWRRRPPEQQAPATQGGLLVMAGGMALLGFSALVNLSALTFIALVIFGAGFGVYTFGGLSLMAVMSPDAEAGAYLGLWTIAILVAKGLGTTFGGVLRDLFLSFDIGVGTAYGAIFLIAAAGLAISAAMLSRPAIISFAADYGRTLSTRAAVAGDS